MKKIVFESKESVGHFEVPNDATLKVPKGMVVNEEPEPEGPLYPAGVHIEGTEENPDDKNRDSWLPPMRFVEETDDAPLIPNV
jgi:hypothetical protein